MTLTRPKPIFGVYEKPFWEYVQKRAVRLQCCSNGHFRYPPGPSCPKCMSTDYSWDEVSGRGKVTSWTVFHRQYFPELPTPYVVVCGSLDEGPLLVANYVGDHAGELKLDMPLQLVYEDSHTQDGDFVIYQWTTVTSES